MLNYKFYFIMLNFNIENKSKLNDIIKYNYINI